MGLRARGSIVLGLVVAAALAGCTTSTPDRDDGTTSAPRATPSSTPSAIEDAAGLSRLLHAGFDRTKSATVHMSGGNSEGDGEFQVDAELAFSAGVVTALRVTGQLPSRVGLDEMVVVGGIGYLRASDPPDRSATPWHRLGGTGGDPMTAGLTAVVDTIVACASVDRLSDVFATAGSFEPKGEVDPGGRRYSVDDFAPVAAALASELGTDVTLLRAFIDVEGNGQPSGLTSQLTVDGVQVAVSETWTDFDTDVVVALPAAGEIAPQ